MLDPQANSHPFLFNPQNTNNTWQPLNYSSRAKQTAKNFKSWKSMGALRLNAAAKEEEEEEEDSPSGICSPPLWKTHNATATTSPRSPDNFVGNYRSLSPGSRKEAIARGQMEMMQMARDMPESCYELSLKDLVERPRMVDEDEASTDGLMKREEYQKAKKKTKKASVMRRSGSMNSSDGFLLKMVFPVSLGSFRSSKIVMVNKNEKNKIKSDSLERESVTESCGSSVLISGSMKSSSGSSSSSCSSTSRSRRKTNNGCWSFIVRKKRQD